MEHRAWAPGRVNLIGEHTDYNDGWVLPLALSYGCTATVSLGGEDVTVTSAQLDAQVRVPLPELTPGAGWISGDDGWAAYAAGALWALDAAGGAVIELDSTVPLGAGLSSSAAVTCSVVLAVAAALGRDLPPAEVVEAAVRTETVFAGAPTGGMDQLVSVFGRPGHLVLCDMRDRSVEAIPFAPGDEGLALLVVDSRAPHRLVDGEYRARRADCERAAELLGLPALRDVADLEAALAALPDDRLRRRVRHVVGENERVLQVAELLRAGDLRAIGPVLTASHASMRDDFEITVPEIDLAVETLLDAGALGARMTGGGFGGCVIALVPAAEAETAAAAVADAYRQRGWNEPDWFTAEACGGAHVVAPR